MTRLKLCFFIIAATLILPPFANGQQFPDATARHRHARRNMSVAARPLPLSSLFPTILPATGSPANVHVDILPAHATNHFHPFQALGAGVDAVNAGAPAKIYTATNIAQMLAAGHGPLTYRLYTELSVQDWHWNPDGQWSDPAGQGYFTGKIQNTKAITDSYGYRLPHSGFTHNQGNDDDYSRLTDGDLTTYWKSNPYLTRRYTGEADSLHPQWIVVDLGTTRSVDAIRLAWANPYAVHYSVEYWTGADPFGDPANGSWTTFPAGVIANGKGGTVTLRLSTTPITAQFIRVLMTASSGTPDTHGSSDPRNSLGYAVAEVGIGKLSGTAFTDYVMHGADNQSQSVTYVSSVDPWHAPANHVADEEQPGLDRVLSSKLTRGLPAIVPVAMLYGTPDDAVAEIAYLQRQKYPIACVEMGEEPDGQYILPEDYGALYIQWATALHKIAPTLKLGGPVFAEGYDVPTWPDASGNTSWLTRFVAYLTAHNRLANLSFISMEHYPFAPDPTDWSPLLQEPSQVDLIFQAVQSSGLPAHFPTLVTEYNVSAGYDDTPVETLGALWQADFLGYFLTQGGQGAYYYEYEPLPLVSAGGSWGTFGMFTVDANGHIRNDTAQFFSSQIVNTEWAQPGNSVHDVYPALSDLKDASGNLLVTCYALHRPDGKWALLLVNKDPNNDHTIKITFHDTADRHFIGPVSLISFGVKNYQWHPNGANGYPKPDGPATRTTLTGATNTVYNLPRGSLTVLRGSVQ